MFHDELNFDDSDIELCVNWCRDQINSKFKSLKIEAEGFKDSEKAIFAIFVVFIGFKLDDLFSEHKVILEACGI